jgi:hypothetical protein
MGKNNRVIREALEKKYGKGCWFAKAHLAERLEQEGIGALSYKKFVERQHYTKKKLNKLEKNMTLHHLKHQSEGGATTMENGAVVSEIAHRYLHNGLNRDQEEIANNMLREFKGDNKTKKRENYQEVKLELTDDLVFPIEIKTAEISFSRETGVQFNVLEEMTEEEIAEYRRHKQERNERVFKKFERSESYELER